MRSAIPTPTISAFEIGPLTIHFYALCIIAGIALAIWLGNRRFLTSFPQGTGVVADVAVLAIPAGVIGGRLYHVATSPENYLGDQGRLIDALKIWEGGLGIWGAIALGSVVAYFYYKRIASTKELPSFAYFADALAPGIALAQAIGRWGNWFNAELFGRPLDAPWALSIPARSRPVGYENFETFHPTFLYESIWCLLIAVVLLALRKRLAPGSIFLLYIALYCFGRFFIEGLRIDSTHSFAGLRLNQYVAGLLFLSAGAACLKFYRASR
ncbi:MAG: prolipoprotein diacylglyceryl transferase [Candidatus Planktophila sp.]|nr:prolipoprotein diacylglyceryl transferase [Candidatus Planktophila sp.]MSO24640.1 prolipoprotein diacylglyceryl transferase [Candidatus Planktophila sp.]